MSRSENDANVTGANGQIMNFKNLSINHQITNGKMSPYKFYSSLNIKSLKFLQWQYSFIGLAQQNKVNQEASFIENYTQISLHEFNSLDKEDSKWTNEYDPVKDINYVNTIDFTEHDEDDINCLDDFNLYDDI